MFRRLVFVGLAAAILAACSSGGGEGGSVTTVPFGFDASTTTLLPSTPVVARALSPAPASVQGAGGLGMVVALTFSAQDPADLPAEFRLGGAGGAPAPAAKPGHNPAFPGLVVGLSSTGSALGGPSVNLANLFQVVSPSLQLDGSRQVTAVWTNPTVDFGSDIDATLFAYVVAGTAPDTIPPTPANIEVLSNALEITFHIGAGEPSTAVAVASPAATSSTSATTTTVRATTTTARPATATTLAPATTTVPPTTTTTKFLGIF